MNDCYFEKKDWRLCKKEVSKEGFILATIFLSFNHVRMEYVSEFEVS